MQKYFLYFFYSADSWISSALSVLQHLPNGYDILCRHARDQPYMKKIKLFFAISDYYKSLSKPLIDDSMKDIIKAIVQMLGKLPIGSLLIIRVVSITTCNLT